MLLKDLSHEVKIIVPQRRVDAKVSNETRQTPQARNLNFGKGVFKQELNCLKKNIDFNILDK